MIPRRALAALVAFAFLVPATHAGAADSDKTQAQKLVLRAADSYEKGAYAEALAGFRAAYELFPSPRLLYDLGMCQLKLGHDVEAANAFQRFLDAAKDDPSLQNQDTARVQLDGLSVHLGRIDLQLSPEQTQVAIDGASIKAGSTFVAPGDHTLVGSAPGYATRTRKVTLDAGSHVGVKLSLRTDADEARVRAKRNAAGAAAKASVALSVSSSPGGAEISIDDDDVGAAPTISTLVPGPHTLSAVLPGYVAASSQVTLEDGKPMAVELRLDREARPRLWTWVAAGATGAAAVTALSFGLSASGASSALLKSPHGPNGVNALYNQVETRSHLSNGFTATAGILGAVSVTLFFVEPWL